MFHDPKRRRAGDALSLQRDEASGIWYVAEFDVPAGTPPGDRPSPADFPGLLFYYYRDNDGEPLRLVSYWASRADFDASRRRLQWKLGLELPVTRGYAQELTFQRKPLWKRVTAYGLLLHLVAVLGALAALEKHYSWLFEAPMLTIDVGGSDPIDIAEGETLAQSVEIANRSRSVQAMVVSAGATVTPEAGGQPTPLPSLRLPPPVQEGKEETIRVPIPRIPAGRYRLAVEVKAGAGHLRRARSFPETRPLKVWIPEPVARITDVEQNPNGAWLYAELELGKDAPRGVTCQVRIFSEPAVVIGPLAVTSAKEGSPVHDRTPGLEVSSKSWTTPPLARFRTYPLKLALKGMPRAGWDELAARSKIACSLE